MIKILIVDDEKPICDLIDLNLSAAGYFAKRTGRHESNRMHRERKI